MLLGPMSAASQSDIDWDTYWPSDDEKILNAINDGELNFLDRAPEKPVHHHHNSFVIKQSSIDTGWIKLDQCHENLDKIQRVQIVYNADRIRGLRITEQRNIGEARVEGHTVQLTDVKDNARVCIKAESRALAIDEDGTYILQNGPFMRKFLDGYFPMRVTIDIQLPDNLRFIDIEPGEQEGFKVVSEKDRLQLDTWFEGRLVTKIKFRRLPNT
jgi:hypothetical protein